MRRLASFCGIFAALGLMATPSLAGSSRVRACHGGFFDLPIGPDGKARHDKSAPSACHAALCGSRKRRATQG